jgi:hypothetical protein
MIRIPPFLVPHGRSPFHRAQQLRAAREERWRSAVALAPTTAAFSPAGRSLPHRGRTLPKERLPRG